MSEPFIAEVRIWGLTFAPRGWAFCNGQLLPISQNTALFSLIGTTYGGDGRTTVALPNLQGRAPMHPGNGPGLSSRRLGQYGGTEAETLTPAQMASHSHTVQAAGTAAGPVNTPANNLPVISGGRGGVSRYGSAAQGNMSADTLSDTGGGQSHANMQPYLTLTFTIALQGLYPSRS